MGKRQTAIAMADKISDQPAIDTARLAMAIDGEGSISIGSAGPNRARQLRVTVTNTDIRLVDWCKRVAGIGSVCVTRGGKLRPGANKILYQWVASHRCAEAVLLACLPYFIIKREQAEIALIYQTTFHFSGKKRAQADVEYQPLRDYCNTTLAEMHARKFSPKRGSE